MQHYYTSYSFLNHVMCICVCICITLKENQRKQASQSEVRKFWSTSVTLSHAAWTEDAKAWQICGIQAFSPVNSIRDSSNAQKVKQKLTFAKQSENPEDKRKDTLSDKLLL